MSPAAKKIPRVAFLFTSSREEIVSGVQTGEDADTALHGFNHIPGATYFTIFPKSMRSVVFVPRLLQYDFVIAQDNLLLGYFVSLLSRAFRLRTRWLYIAISSSTLIRRHSAHPVRLFLLKKFWASYTRIICISSEQREDFIRLGIPSKSLVFLPLGIDESFFKLTDTSLEEDFIVSVGRDMGRDYGTLFEAAERTKHAFIVVAMEKNIPSDRPIPSNVEVRYNRSLAEIRELYVRARLVVIASKDSLVPDGSDCSGQTVIMDALGAGKAVIATERSWITDYFVPNQDLVVVPPNDPEALAEAIDSLSNDAPRRQRLAASGRSKVLAHYTTKKFAESLQKLMETVL